MTEEGILELLKTGAPEAADELSRRYRSVCYSICFGVLRSSQDAEECVNDTLLKVWREPPQSGETNLRAYVCKVARNTAIDRYKLQKAQKRGGGQVPLIVEELSECLPTGSGRDPIDDIALKEILSRFVSSLSPGERKVFVKRYWYSMSIEEVANETGASPGTVKMKLMRTRRKLKKLLEKEGIEV